MVSLSLSQLGEDQAMQSFENMSGVYQRLAQEASDYRVLDFKEDRDVWFLLFQAGQKQFELVIKWLTR